MATALVPIGNLTLAAREVLAGRAATGPLLAVACATGLHAWLASVGAARLLGREDVILGGGSKARRAHERFGPEVFATACAVLLGVWFLVDLPYAGIKHFVDDVNRTQPASAGEIVADLFVLAAGSLLLLRSRALARVWLRAQSAGEREP